MRSKRSRLALMGVLALVLSVTVGLVSGSVADAKKKKKKSSNVVTVSNNTLPYTLGGGGKISGPVGLIKQGGGRLILDETGGNDFSGRQYNILYRRKCCVISCNIRTNLSMEKKRNECWGKYEYLYRQFYS
jgi:hypothetical protein